MRDPSEELLGGVPVVSVEEFYNRTLEKRTATARGKRERVTTIRVQEKEAYEADTTQTLVRESRTIIVTALVVTALLALVWMLFLRTTQV